MTDYYDQDQWSERQAASFRGVPFGFVSMKGKTGRRALPHEYPKRNAGWTEDHGGVLNNETITAVLVGPTAEDDFLRLLAALNVAGPGELVHPYWGIQQVQVGDVDYDLDNNERYKASLTFKVYAAGENLFPQESNNTNAQVDAQSDTAHNANIESFEKQVANYDTDQLATLNDTVNSLLNDLDEFVYGLPGIPDAIGDWTDTLDHLIGSTARLLAYPGELARDITNAIIDVKDLVTTLPPALNVYDQMIGRWAGLVTEFNPDTQVDQKAKLEATVKRNTYATFTGSATVAKAQAISAAPQTGDDAGFSDSEQASQAASVLVEQLQDLATVAIETGNRNSWRAYRQLRLAVNEDMNVRIQRLPQLVKVKPRRTIPVALLAYQQTGNTENRTDIVKRNRLSRPSFITPDMTVEVVNEVSS